MSAYLVHTDTIDYIVAMLRVHRPHGGQTFYFRGPYADRESLEQAGIIEHHTAKLVWTEAETIGAVLYHQNWRSIEARYPDCVGRPERAPGPINASPYYAQKHVSAPQAVIALKSLACLEYQSCETDDYQQTLAYALLKWIEGICINAIPGYDEAPWGWEREVAS